MLEKENKIFKTAEADVEYLTGDAEARRIAQMEADWDFDWKTSMRNSRKEGEEIGIKKGKKAGIEETAKKMKDAKTDIDFISQMTGLTKEEIEKL